MAGRQVSSHDSTLSYLPLAHIFDRIVEEFALFSGARIGYFQVLSPFIVPGISIASLVCVCARTCVSMCTNTCWLHMYMSQVKGDRWEQLSEHLRVVLHWRCAG